MTTSGTLKVAVIVLGGIAVNKLSELFDATAPVILGGSFVVLIGMIFYETYRVSDKRAANKASGVMDTLDLAKFCLASMLLGAAVSAVSMLPLFPDRIMPALIPVEGVVSKYHLFELGATSFITVLAVVAVARRSSPIQVLAFLASAIAGMTLAIAVRPVTGSERFSFMFTFLGWFLAAGAVTFLVHMLPDIVRLYAGFWFGRRAGIDIGGMSSEKKPADE